MLLKIFKVAVVTPITNLRQYLNDLSIKTNMKMLTAEAALGFILIIIVISLNFCFF